MVNKSKFFKPKVITLAKQAMAIDKQYSNFRTEITGDGHLICIGNISPSSISRKYTIKITYIIGKRPKVEVINPKLKDVKEKIPHTYMQNELCLYYPKFKEWTKYDYISETIIPWCSLWLYYYEIWKVTGEWLGGGKHPNNS
ncbi:hypothetical protein [Terrisporobacter sp.]